MAVNQPPATPSVPTLATPKTDALAETFHEMPDWHAIVDAAVEHGKTLERELAIQDAANDILESLLAEAQARIAALSETRGPDPTNNELAGIIEGELKGQRNADGSTRPVYLYANQWAAICEALRAPVSATADMVPRSRYDACNQDWLNAKAEVEKKQALLTFVGQLLEKHITTAEVIQALSDDAMNRVSK